MLSPHLSPKDINIVTKGHKKDIYDANAVGAKVRRRSEQDIEYASANIAQEYKRRIGCSKATASLVAERRSALIAEQKAMDVCRASVVKMLFVLQRPLALTMAWTNTQRMSRQTSSRQGSRATQEGGTDEVRNALLLAQASMKRNISRLTELLLDADTCRQELRATRDRYDQDISESHEAIRADVACLHKREVPADLAGKRFTAGGITLSLGTVAVERSKTTRLTVTEALKAMHEAGAGNKPAVVIDALQGRVSQQQQQCSNLEASVKMLSGELNVIKRNAATAAQTMAKVEAQIGETERRLRASPGRAAGGGGPPGREARIERRSVEQTLDVELLNLRRSKAAIAEQLAGYAAKKRRVRRLVSDVERETLERVAALRTDRECRAMELPPIGRASPRRTS